MSVTFDYSGKVALVTGAAGGIGEAIAQVFVAAGASVVLSDISPKVSDVAQGLCESGAKACAVVADVTNASDCKKMVDVAIEQYGRLDFSINNAGSNSPQVPIADMPIEDWDLAIKINQSGVFYCMHHQIPAMLTTGGGTIINISSVCGVSGFVGSSPYVAAKHAVVGLTKRAAVEYGSQGIRCLSVGPGLVATDMTREANDEAMNDFILSRVPMGRTGTVGEIAKAVRMLCSEEASYVNGAYLQVDGGLLQT